MLLEYQILMQMLCFGAVDIDLFLLDWYALLQSILGKQVILKSWK